MREIPRGSAVGGGGAERREQLRVSEKIQVRRAGSPRREIEAGGAGLGEQESLVDREPEDVGQRPAVFGGDQLDEREPPADAGSFPGAPNSDPSSAEPGLNAGASAASSA